MRLPRGQIALGACRNGAGCEGDALRDDDLEGIGCVASGRDRFDAVVLGGREDARPIVLGMQLAGVLILAYAILRHELLDLRYVVRQMIRYGMITTLTALVYIFAFGALLGLARRVDLEQEVRDKAQVKQLLEAIRRYGGRYFNAGTEQDLEAASATINSLEKGLLVNKVHVRDEPVYQWFALPALVCLATAMALRAVPYFTDLT